ncbi:hypothetical protein IHE45_19G039200 [Dioscorea alata]|uniref:Uncharacterized protein n=1 Tax=Dioscorea alata TaxID=55571 RepID=A0ACB7TXK1_DIOAL|nr:hypothetical protein IHE45_19G039200 [Dioscorea alata]
MVYAHINNSVDNLNSWNGWCNIWRLKIAPRFCNLEAETSEHLFNTCSKAQIFWNLVGNSLGKQICFSEGFSSGNWLCPSNPDFNKFDQSVIAVASWFIWKARCNLIFRNESPDFHAIPVRAINHLGVTRLGCLALASFSPTSTISFFVLVAVATLWSQLLKLRQWPFTRP